MFRKVEVAMSSIKLKLLKTLELQYSSLPAKKTLLKSAGSFFDQGRVRGGAIVVPDPQERHSMGKKGINF